MSKKHTPWPWAVEWVRPTGARIKGADGRQFATIYGETEGEAKANVALMLSSLELLDALKLVIRGVPSTWEGVQQSRAAIAKATGG